MFNQYEELRKNGLNKIKQYEDYIANEENPEWKRNQAVGKLYRLKRTWTPKVFWDTYTKGTYKKAKEN